jgi:2,3-bisphosphoglycerate-dependent phosphoglycerate mutase
MKGSEHTCASRWRLAPYLIPFLAAFSIAWGASFPITIILVRHAEKADAPANDPVLSEAGQARAKALEATLADAGIRAIYTSEAVRTQLTVKPLADRLRLQVNRSFKAAQTAELAKAIANGPDRVVLVAGHSNTVPGIIAALGGGTVPEIQEPWEYDNLYVVTLYAPGKASTVRLHYGTPSKPGAVTLAEGGRIMKIQIERSGGIAAIPGLNLQATLDLSGPTPQVTQADGYSRTLAPQEAQEVQHMLDPSLFFQLPSELRKLNESNTAKGRTSVADQYQYDITLQLDNGRKHTVTVSDGMIADLERTAPGLGKFLEWAKQELNAIWEQKLQRR